MNAIESLKVDILRKAYTKEEAENFLMNDCNIAPRKAARGVIEQNDGRHWKPEEPGA